MHGHQSCLLRDCQRIEHRVFLDGVREIMVALESVDAQQKGYTANVPAKIPSASLNVLISTCSNQFVNNQAREESTMAFVNSNYQLSEEEKPRYIDGIGDRSIVVHNLPCEMGAREIKKSFEGFGRVLTILATNYDGVQKFTAFITFARAENAREAIAFSKSIAYILDDKTHAFTIERVYGPIRPRRLVKNIRFKMFDEEINSRTLVISPGCPNKWGTRAELPVNGSGNGTAIFINF